MGPFFRSRQLHDLWSPGKSLDSRLRTPACGRILPSFFDTPVFTAHENISSTFREEAPKQATFHGNRDSSCNIDDPE